MSTSKESKRKVKKKKYFIHDWLQHEAFGNWLVKDKKDNTKARCSVCHKTIELSSSGCLALTDHAKGMKHISGVNKLSTLIQSKISKKSGPVPAKSNHVNSTIVVDSVKSWNQGAMDTFVTDFDSTIAEIIWSLNFLPKGFSNGANDELTETFAAMFPDSRIGKCFSFARINSMYTVTHGLAPYFKSVLGRPSKKYLVRVTRPTVFLDRKNTNIWVREFENSNITVFKNFRIMSREKAVTNTCPQFQRIIHRCIINSHFSFPSLFIYWKLHWLN